MNNLDIKAIRKLASRWAEAGGKDSEAWGELEDLIDSEPIAALRVIEEIQHLLTLSLPHDLAACALLAAGPLEALLVRRGSDVIDGVEQLARSDTEFRKLLSGVWKGTMEDELHARVQKASDPTFKFR